MIFPSFSPLLVSSSQFFAPHSSPECGVMKLSCLLPWCKEPDHLVYHILPFIWLTSDVIVVFHGLLHDPRSGFLDRSLVVVAKSRDHRAIFPTLSSICLNDKGRVIICDIPTLNSGYVSRKFSFVTTAHRR